MAGFACLVAASVLPTPYDVGIGFLVFMSFVARDRYVWIRYALTFAWMCSRVWPAWIYDPYAFVDLAHVALGGLFLSRLVQHMPRRVVEIAYAILVLFPNHTSPHVLISTTFLITGACLIVCDVQDVIPSSIWILCLRTPIACVLPLSYDVWMLRKKFEKPHVAVVSKSTEPVVVTTPRNVLRTARVPPAYYSRISIRNAQLFTHDLKEYAPIASEVV